MKAVVTIFYKIKGFIPDKKTSRSRGGLGKRILAVLVCTGILCSAVCVTVRNGGEGGGFTPRFSPPGYGDYCYYGGNIFYNSGYGMPNCTAYAWGRVYEITGEKPELCTGDAGGWFEYNKNNNIYKYGFTPGVGAIACFDNQYGGHVAVVEQIQEGRITFSNSAFGGENFYLTTASVDDPNPGQEGWDFQGYIYPGNFTPEVSYLNSFYRISSPCGLNLREHAGINSHILDTIPQGAQIFISSAYSCDGYCWGFTHYNGSSGYCVIDYTESIDY